MSEADVLVHQYLLSVSAKLSKQFAKKRPGYAQGVWNGPALPDLIDFYKRNSASNGTAETAPEKTAVPGSDKVTPPAPESAAADESKRGKKRKHSEMSEPEPAAVAVIGKKDKKKKKKKGKTNGEINGDIVAKVEEIGLKPVVGGLVGAEDTTPETKEDDDELKDPVFENGNEVEESAVVNGDKPKKSKKKKGPNSSFRRVKEEEVAIDKAELADNTFEAKGGADDYGFQANQILKHTKGRSFRHEKTKKKRGTYKGGAINMSVSSIKFDSDSE